MTVLYKNLANLLYKLKQSNYDLHSIPHSHYNSRSNSNIIDHHQYYTIYIQFLPKTDKSVASFDRGKSL